MSTWLQPASGFWNDPANWSTPNYPNNGVPTGITYDAFLSAGGTPYTIQLSADTSLDSLTLGFSDATLAQSGGTLALSALNLQSGTFQTASSTIAAATIAAAAGTQLTGSVGDPSRASTLDNVGLASDLTLRGSFKLNNLQPFSNHTLYFSASNDTLTFASLAAVSGVGQIVLNSDSGKTATVSSPAATNLLIPQGITLRETTGNGQLTPGGDTLINRGIIQVANFKTTLLMTASSVVNQGTIQGTSLTTIHITNLNNSGTITLAGHTSLILDGNWMNSGTISGNGSFIYLGGTCSSFGTITNSRGPVALISTYTTAQLRTLAPTVVTAVSAGGTLDNTGDSYALTGTRGSIGLQGGTLLGGDFISSNGGTIGVSDDSAIISASIHAPVNVPEDGLALLGDWHNYNTISLITPSDTISYSRLLLGGSDPFSRLGNFTRGVSNTFVYLCNVMDNTSSSYDLNVTPAGPVGLGPGAYIKGGTLTSSGPVPDINTIFRNTSTPATLDNVTLANDLNLRLNGSSLNITNGLNLRSANIHVSYIYPDGTAQPSLIFSGSQTLGGTGQIICDKVVPTLITATDGSTLTIGPGITFTNWAQFGDTALPVNNFFIINQGSLIGNIGINCKSFTNAGTVQAIGTGIFFYAGVNITNDINGTLTGGTWAVYDIPTHFGDLDLGAYFDNSKNIHTNAANVILSGSKATFVELKTIQHNAGSLAFYQGNNFTTQSMFTNDGSLILGAGADFTSTDAFTQSTQGGLLFELAGDSSEEDYGQLHALKSANLNGLLTLALTAGYTPQVGDDFDLISAVSLAGQFSSYSFPALSDGLMWQVQYTPTDFSVTVVAPEPSLHITLLAAALLIYRRSRRRP